MAKSSGPLEIIAGMGKTELAKAEAKASETAIKSHAGTKYSDNIRDITTSGADIAIINLGVDAQLELARINAGL